MIIKKKNTKRQPKDRTVSIGVDVMVLPAPPHRLPRSLIFVHNLHKWKNYKCTLLDTFVLMSHTFR